MTALIKYEAARYALKIAQQVDEVKDIRDKAQALAAYARQAKDEDMIRWATEIKLRAERRTGELLNGSERNKGAIAAVTSGDRVAPTLAEIGLSKKQSSDFQAIATIPEEKFEEEVKKPTTTTKSLVRGSPKRKEKAGKEAKAPKPKKEKAEKAVNFDPAKCPSKDTCTIAIAYQELQDNYDVLADDAKTADAIMGTKAAIEMQKLREELRVCTRSRDSLMTQAVSMEKQINWWRKEAEKLGYKSEKKKK